MFDEEEQEEVKSLKELINNYLNNFNALDINEYFVNSFSDDWNSFYDVSSDILEYLHNAFHEIDLNYRGNEMFDNKVKEVLETVLSMMENN